MKKYMIMVIVGIMVIIMIATGCNKYDRKEACIECKFGLEYGRDFGCMTWDVHKYYGYNNREQAEIEREVLKRNGEICTEIESEYYEGRVVYKFKTLYIAE